MVWLLVVTPEDGVIRMASAALLEAAARDADEVIGADVSVLLADLPEHWPDFDALAAGRRPIPEIVAGSLVLGDGTNQPVQLRPTLIEDGTRSLLHVELCPARLADQDALGQDSALLRSIIDTAPDAIITIDAGGLVLSFSPAAERMFGYAAEDVVGRNVNMLMPEPYQSEHDGYLERYQTTGEKRIIGIGRTVIAKRDDGSTFPIELAVGEVRGGNDTIFTGFIRDISEREAARSRAVKLQQELNHVGRLTAMGEIASMIVHELNQPLTAIANFGEAAQRLIERDVTGPSRAGEFVERTVTQAHRASQMIQRLRRFVSPGSGDIEPLEVNEVVRDAARLALIGSADQRIRAEFALAENLPMISADRIQVQQVVVNLIRNAIDAMVEMPGTADAEKTLVVETLRTVDGDAAIAVIDSGPGVAPEIADRLFSPFATTKSGGMGIGLSVSKSIVDAHGGRIWCEPSQPSGSRFVFVLPHGPIRPGIEVEQ